MKIRVLPAAAALLALTATATAQEAQQPPAGAAPSAAQQQAQQAQMQAINTYATILFAREIEKRCQHLAEEKRTAFNADVATLDGYMADKLPKDMVDSMRKDVTEAGKDAEKNPCNDESKQFVQQSAAATAQISESIEQEGQ